MGHIVSIEFQRDFREFSRESRDYEQRDKAYLAASLEITKRWVAVLPFRYLGELPCWRVDCPLCGAEGDLWITPVPIDTAEGWKCYTCLREGMDPESLAEALAQKPPER